MKALYDRTQDRQGQSGASDLAARVELIFKHYPMLCGFSVQDDSALTTERAMVELQGGLWLADVAVNAPPGFRMTREFCDQIAGALLELLDEQPEVLELLPGRTFARTLH
jgi:hypothetical protein